MNYRNTILQGCAYNKLQELPKEIVQTCVTSPPYYALRDYGAHVKSSFPEVTFSIFGFQITIPAWEGQLGLEPTPQMYIGHMVLIFREVKRVLRKDGTCWINIGDSYNGSGSGGNPENSKWKGFHGKGEQSCVKTGKKDISGLKPKDLLGIPWMLAFALRDDGWYLRSDIIWHKPNPMPESVTDRPTKSHEYIFLLSKSKKYFYDAEAVKVNAENPNQERTSKTDRKRFPTAKVNGIRNRKDSYYLMANKRSVWSITTQPYPEAHYATFPEELPETCIKAGTSEKGACVCGAPYERILQKKAMVINRSKRRDNMGLNHATGTVSSGTMVSPPEAKTVGWIGACTCKHEEIQPCLVLDPFAGSGTTQSVAHKLGRDYLGIELNPEYIKHNINKRLHKAEGLFKKPDLMEVKQTV